MKYIAYIVISAIVGIISADDALIISHDGETILVNDYSISGDTISFTSLEGESDKVKRDEIFELLVRAKRSTEYTSKETNENIASVRRVFREFPGLRKQLQPMLDEWLRVRSQFEELSPAKKAELQREIDKLFDNYKYSLKDEPAYLKLRQGLEMIRYRDLRGAFEDDITEKLLKLGNELIVTKAGEIEKEINAGGITLESYRKIQSLTRRLMTYYPPKDIRDGLTELQQDAGKVCLRNELKLSWKRFGAGRDGAAYIKENATLGKLNDEFTYIPEVADRTQALRTKMQDALIMHYDFNNKSLPQFPLSKSDKQMLRHTFGQCSSITEPISNPTAILFPAEPVQVVHVKKTEVVVLRAVFKQAPEEGLRLYFDPFNTVMKIKTPLNGTGVDIRFSSGLLLHMMETLYQEKKERPKEVKISLVEGDVNKPLTNPITFSLAP